MQDKTAVEYAAEAMLAALAKHFGISVEGMTHAILAAMDEAAPLHAAQDWSYKADVERAKRLLRRADGRLEELCEHGIGHTVAIDRVPFREGAAHYKDTSQKWRDAWWSHGCDGCCKDMERMHD